MPYYPWPGTRLTALPATAPEQSKCWNQEQAAKAIKVVTFRLGGFITGDCFMRDFWQLCRRRLTCCGIYGLNRFGGFCLNWPGLIHLRHERRRNVWLRRRWRFTRRKKIIREGLVGI